MKPLTKLSSGERAYIVDMRDGEICSILFEMRIFPGDMVEIKDNSANNNSVVIKVGNRTLNLVKNSAETIITNAVSFEINLN